MSFAAPVYLLALLAVPVGVALYLVRERAIRRGRAAMAPAALLPSLTPQRPGWRRHAPVAVYGLAAVALCVALARPHASLAVATEQATVVVVTDRSGSMLAGDVAPDRLTAARAAADSFLDAVPHEIRVGAIAFNQGADVLQSPTRDHEAVREALAGVEAGGSTATGDALATALGLIERARAASAPEGDADGERPPAPAAVVLLSDGESVRGRDPLEVAEEAAAAQVPVYTVALGTEQGTITSSTGREVPVPPDPVTLERMAATTGGAAFTVDEAHELEQVYARLGSEVATERQEREITSGFAAGGLLLLVAAAASSLRWFGRFL